jgi:hypothetical protein
MLLLLLLPFFLLPAVFHTVNLLQARVLHECGGLSS